MLLGRKPTLVTLAEVEISLDLTQAGVHLSAEHAQVLTLANEIADVIYRNKISSNAISFALPRDAVFIHILPVDATLKGPQLKEFLLWEVGQYYPDIPLQEFIIDAHVLSKADTRSPQIFVVAVRRGMVMFLQKVASKLKLTVRFIDIDQFSSERALLYNHPEVLDGTVVLFGIRYAGVDASLLQKGELIDYRFFAGEYPNTIPEASAEYFRYIKDIGIKKPGAIFFAGLNVPVETIDMVKANTKIPTMACNPLKKLPTMNKVFHSFTRESSRFTAAIGLALRSE